MGGIEPPLYNPKLYALPITLQSEREREGGIGVRELNIKRDSRLIVGLKFAFTLINIKFNLGILGKKNGEAVTLIIRKEVSKKGEERL